MYILVYLIHFMVLYICHFSPNLSGTTESELLTVSFLDFYQSVTHPATAWKPIKLLSRNLDFDLELTSKCGLFVCEPARAKTNLV